VLPDLDFGDVLAIRHPRQAPLKLNQRPHKPVGQFQNVPGEIGKNDDRTDQQRVVIVEELGEQVAERSGLPGVARPFNEFSRRIGLGACPAGDS